MSTSLIEMDTILDTSEEEVSIVDGEIHPNLKLFSNSSNVTLHKCPRKFELYKLTPPMPGVDDGDEHLDFGSIVGVGVQEFLTSRDINKTYWKMFCSWKNILDDDNGSKSRKTFWHALFAIDKFAGQRNTELATYDLAHFDGKPATELGFSIDCGDGFFYRGFLDALLIDRMRGELVVYEGKTTKNKEPHPAMYSNSGQALGYSLVVDAIAHYLGLDTGGSFKVIYNIYGTFTFDWIRMDVQKNHTQRALWIKNILIDKAHTEEYARDGFFPMHGENCFDFFRPCQWYGTCEMSNKHLFPGPVAVRRDSEEKYPFKYNLVELIEAQLAKQEVEV